MKIKDISNIKCGLVNEHRVSISWDANGRRFHVWVNNDGSMTSDDLHCNPPVGTKYATSGPDAHRLLSAKAAANADAVAYVLGYAKEHDLIPLARAAEIQRKADIDHRNAVAEYEAYKAVLDAAPVIGGLSRNMTADEVIEFGRAIRRADCKHERY